MPAAGIPAHEPVRRKQQAVHVPAIDALRGLAVLLVWLHHLQAYCRIDLLLPGRIGGLIGVQLFFVISGYLIMRSALGETLAGYAVRRILRIFPCYWIVVLTVTLLSPRVSLGLVHQEPLAFVANLLALSHWWPPSLQFFDVTTVSWTLSIELAWYLLAPLLAWWLGSCGTGAGRWLGMGATALLLSSGWVLAAQGGHLDAVFAPGIAAAGVSPVNGFMRFAYIVNAAPAQLVFFVAGALVLRFEVLLRSLPTAMLALAILATVPVVERWNAALGLHPSFVSGIGLTALFVLAIGAAREADRNPSKPVAWSLLVAGLTRLGRISYPVYLVHVPVLVAALALLPEREGTSSWPAAVLAIPVTLALASLLHHAVERPGIALGRRLSARRPARG